VASCNESKMFEGNSTSHQGITDFLKGLLTWEGKIMINNERGLSEIHSTARKKTLAMPVQGLFPLLFLTFRINQ